MTKLLVFTLVSLAWATQAAMALTVTEAEVVNKVRAVALQEVRFEGQAKVVLADAQGISLYTFDNDTEGKSNCGGGCLTVWPPLNISADEVVVGPFGKIMGNNGKPQLTLKGLPLYYFQRDQKPGDVFGHYPSWQLIFVNK